MNNNVIDKVNKSRPFKSWITSCVKKRRYPNEQVALEKINQIKKKRKGAQLRVYYCEYCCGYHLTHLV